MKFLKKLHHFIHALGESLQSKDLKTKRVTHLFFAISFLTLILLGIEIQRTSLYFFKKKLTPSVTSFQTATPEWAQTPKPAFSENTFEPQTHQILSMGNFTVSFQEQSRMNHPKITSLEISLECSPESTCEWIQALASKVNNTLSDQLIGSTEAEFFSPSGAMRLKNKMKHEVNHLLKMASQPGQVSAVYFSKQLTN